MAAAVGTGGARGVKRIESLVEELGVKLPQVSTRAVCRRGSSCARRRRAARAAREPLPAGGAHRHHRVRRGGGGGPRGAAAAKVFQEVGLPDTPAEAVRGAPGPDGQPIGIRRRSASRRRCGAVRGRRPRRRPRRSQAPEALRRERKDARRRRLTKARARLVSYARKGERYFRETLRLARSRALNAALVADRGRSNLRERLSSR